MLKQIFKEDLRPCVTIITDSVPSPGSDLFLAFINQLSERCDVVHLYLFENCPNKFVSSLLPATISKVVLHDYWSDPLGWIHPGETKDIAKFSFAELTRESIGNRRKVAVVIDCVSKLLRCCGMQKFSFSVQKLQAGIRACDSECVFLGLLHRDTVEHSVIKCLEYLSDTMINVVNEDDILNIVEKRKRSQSQKRRQRLCKIMQKKQTGKVNESVESFSLMKGVIVAAELWTRNGHDEASVGPSPEEPDPTANLTFNLSLSSEEKNARGKLVMPYTKPRHVEVKLDEGAPSKQPGYIYYEPDEADDFDEEDPDDDLDF